MTNIIPENYTHYAVSDKTTTGFNFYKKDQNVVCVWVDNKWVQEWNFDSIPNVKKKYEV